MLLPHGWTLYFWTALSSFGVAIFGVEGGGELATFGI